MPELKKYLFDNFVIDAESKNQKPSEPPKVEESPKEIVVEPAVVEEIPRQKLYAEEDVEEMTRQSNEEGYEKGYKAAQEEIEAEHKLLLGTIKAELESIINDNCVLRTKLEKQFAELGKVLLKKVIPPLQEEYADKIIEDFIRDNFAQIKDENKLAFYLHPDSIKAAQEVISSIAGQADFEGKISIHKEDSLGRSEARIEWEDGGIECKTDGLINKVANLLDEG